jgi:hypothetical protein
MRRKKLFNSLQKDFPDGEGFNALPIAFVYTDRAERNPVQSKRNWQSRFDFAPEFTLSLPKGSLRSARRLKR